MSPLTRFKGRSRKDRINKNNKAVQRFGTVALYQTLERL